MNVKYILVLHSKQYTFHFRARLAAGLRAARDGGFWLAAKAYEMTSAWARPIESASARNFLISASLPSTPTLAVSAPAHPNSLLSAMLVSVPFSLFSLLFIFLFFFLLFFFFFFFSF